MSIVNGVLESICELQTLACERRLRFCIGLKWGIPCVHEDTVSLWLLLNTEIIKALEVSHSIHHQ